MPLNVGGINPAVLKAKNVATEQYVDTSVSSIDVSYSGLSGKDSLAQELGYTNYSAMQAAAVGGTTVINGGYLNTSLIEAEGITADMVVSSGLITNTAQIGDALITNAKIGNAAITNAKIADAAIDNAKIGTAAVDTLQIAGQAVTIPSAVYTEGTTSVSYTAGWVQVQSLTYTSTGEATAIEASVSATMGSNYSDESMDLACYARIKVNGSIIYTSKKFIHAKDSFLNSSGPLFAAGNFYGGAIYTPPAGTVTVTLEINADDDGATIGNRFIKVLELKR